MTSILTTLAIKPRRTPPEVIRLPDESRTSTSKTHRPAAKKAPAESKGMRARLAFLLGILAVPAVAAPGDFGAMAADAPMESESVARELAATPAMDFERPGMSFPGSAFYYLADPPQQALVALPTTDPLDTGAEDGRELGALIDVGPAARPFFAAGVGASPTRALECLSQAVWYEAASESLAGQRAVAQVVLNRVAHPSWPNSVCGVVYQGSARTTGCQFSFTCDGSLSRRASGSSWRRARDVASDALSGSVYAPVGHATHYHTLWVNPVWASSLDHIGTIGAHRFYKNRGKAGEKAAFSSGYAGAEPGVRGSTIASPVLQTASTGERGTPRIDYTQPAPPAQRSVTPARGSAASPATGGSTGPVIPVITTPEYGGAGQVKEQYSRAGQWKKRPPAIDMPKDQPAPGQARRAQ